MKWTFSTGDFVRIALFAAIIAALGIIPPFNIGPVPITLQTLGVMLAGVVIGPRNGFFAVLLTVFIAILGAPILSGGRNGLTSLASPTIGFFLGWLPAVLVTGWIHRFLPVSNVLARAVTASIVGGIVVLYIFGIAGLSWRTGMSFDKAFIVSMVFVPLDLVKAVAVGFVARMLERWETPSGNSDGSA